MTPSFALPERLVLVMEMTTVVRNGVNVTVNIPGVTFFCEATRKPAGIYLKSIKKRHRKRAKGGKKEKKKGTPRGCLRGEKLWDR